MKNSYSVSACHSISNYFHSNHLRKPYQYTNRQRSSAYSFNFENFWKNKKVASNWLGYSAFETLNVVANSNANA